MYSISIKNEEHSSDKWGDYVVHKEFVVENTKKNRNKTVGVNGFIVQVIEKHTKAYALCGDGYIKEIKNIDEFTSNQVKFMNDSYIELFPIIDGECEYGDNFQNGGVLQYEKYRGKFYPNNNPPTIGKIEQSGLCFFIPVDNKDFVKPVLKKIKSVKNKNLPLNILGMDWNFLNNTPANGLPFREYNMYDINNLLIYKNSNYIQHNVLAEWNGLIKRNNEIQKNIVKNNCDKLLYDDEKISVERELAATTKLISKYNNLKD